jgi:thioredoxin-related protein
MKKIGFILLAFSLFWMAETAVADESGWVTGFAEAAEQARNENKLLLLDFTGSDWCGWCMKLDAETFSRPEFLDYASKNLVLVKVDFPMHTSLPSEVKEGNRALKNKYDVNGYPTVLIVKPDGSVMWEQRGYEPGGPRVMIDAANKCRKAAGLGEPVGDAAPVMAVGTVKPPAPVAPVPVAAAPIPVQQPAPPPANSNEGPKLQAIVYSASHSAAVLDGRTYDEGETARGVHVLKIARDSVTVEVQGRIKVLTLN